MIPICIISVIPQNVPLPEEWLCNGASNNSDGHGWVVASAEHGMYWGKSMDADEAIDACIAERERQGPGSVVLFHSRIGTHGSMGIDNVHPFIVPTLDGSPPMTVMAHNGILPAEWHPELGDPRSDTRVFTDVTAPLFITARGVPSRRGAKTLATKIGPGNKLVFLSTKAVEVTGKPAVRIINSRAGVWDRGVWFSNTSYQRKRYTYKRPAAPAYSNYWASKEERAQEFADRWNSGWWSNADEPVTEVEIDKETSVLLDDIDEALGFGVTDVYSDSVCEVCHIEGCIHIKTNLCLNCHTCLDCWESMENCNCFDYETWLALRNLEQEEIAEALRQETEKEMAEEDAQRIAEKWLAERDSKPTKASARR